MYKTNDFKIGLIYKYTSPSGKIYIGQTVNEKSRKCSHKLDAKKSNTHFAKAIRKYGFENFKYEVIIKFKPTIDLEKLYRVLNELEKRYIKLYNSSCREFGYNIELGGNNSPMQEETKEKLREDIKNRSKEWNEKLSIAAKERCKRGLTEKQLKGLEFGRIEHSEETKNKQREYQRKNMKKVQKYDRENNLLETFESIADAAKSLEGLVQKTKCKRIGECCNNKRKSAYNFIWKFLSPIPL